MKKTILVLAASFLLCPPAHALDVSLGGISNGGKIPPSFAFCQPDGDGKTKPARNINPQIRWSDGPEGTKSYALLVVDPDVPSSFDDANQEGKTIAKDLPRQDFYHWVLINIPEEITSIKQGQNSSSYNITGKKIAQTMYGLNGINDYATFMEGDFRGYDGPCPPWNDERIHHYHFRIYALDVETLDIKPEELTGKKAMEEIKKHMLDMGEAVGTYSNAQ